VGNSLEGNSRAEELRLLVESRLGREAAVYLEAKVMMVSFRAL